MNGDSNVAYRSSRPEVFCEKVVLRNFAKFTGTHLCQSLFLNKVAGLWYRCFPVKVLRTPFSQNTSGGYFCAQVMLNTYNHHCTVKVILHQTECKWNVPRHRFFLLLHMHKSFVYQHFPEMSIPLKSRNHFNFSAPNKCRFLFKPVILDYSCKQSKSLYHGLFTVHNII